MDSCIIARCGKQRILSVIVNCSNCLLVESHGFVWFAAEIEIETKNLNNMKNTLEFYAPTMI